MKWNEKLNGVWDATYYSLDSKIHKTITEQEEYRKNMIKNDSSLTENEKSFLFYELRRVYDAIRVEDNVVEKQKCSNCQKWHQAIQYCEFCIREYLKNDFVNWTSGNNEIDKLIQERQQKIIAPYCVIEWIEYDQIRNIEFLAEGGCATIYTATWLGGSYFNWNSEKQILERCRREKIVLKRLNNSNSNNVHWFHEVTLSFTLDNSFSYLALCYGLTKDPITQDYMLVLKYYDNDLRHFLKEKFHSLTLLQKYDIIYEIALSLANIHIQNIIHRDLHSGNILCSIRTNEWRISDLGLSGPVDKPPNSIYGNLPYIAPEVHCGEIYTKKSDIYSMGILMWEVITGETPYDCEHDLDLTLDIVNGRRPKNCEDIPREYATLMKQCWDAFPKNRPDINAICISIKSLIKLFYDEMDKQQELIKNNQVIINTQLSKNTKSIIYRIPDSKVYSFNLPIKPRNATDEEQLGDQEFGIVESQHFSAKLNRLPSNFYNLIKTKQPYTITFNADDLVLILDAIIIEKDAIIPFSNWEKSLYKY
ncbi:hypothetical protein Glove_109g375 [Diversispora epigaea]|uniref:non-specific serine/threonine protein kinase n=1 Tax=Diversispora epigaea TaxID=1348612 RepID=A0A397JC78_9GLOM|nr:hypothetical protein Glove_109g375 [Diversispora epigaea]